jgi:hypothetical protein
VAGGGRLQVLADARRNDGRRSDILREGYQVEWY